ncbi:MAG: hypothetical protein LBS19_16820, partial [Clostridiales bacterium]|nr:hypothetical protein [Clostridiales bacterium]
MNRRTKKDLSVYFAAWGGLDVKHLPWDRITTLNYAFWQIDPNTFEITDMTPERSAERFKALAEMNAAYPGADIMISVGGWTRSGHFSAMAAARENQEGVITSCVAALEDYPFL